MKTLWPARWLFLCLAAFSITAMIGAQDADLVLTNGNIYTVNENQPRAEAIAVTDQRVVFVGSNEDARKFRGDKTRILDLSGKTVVPGFTDSHCHIFGIGEREMRLNLEGTNSLEGFLAKVKARVAQTERGKWITGRGWIEIQNAGSHAEDIKIIRKCLEDGKLKLRLINAVYGPGEDAQRFLREGPTIDAFDHRFTQRTIKVIFDGALGSRGAALLKPY